MSNSAPFEFSAGFVGFQVPGLALGPRAGPGTGPGPGSPSWGGGPGPGGGVDQDQDWDLT